MKLKQNRRGFYRTSKHEVRSNIAQRQLLKNKISAFKGKATAKSSSTYTGTPPSEASPKSPSLTLAITDEVTKLALALQKAGALPHAATGDAMHVALAAYHEVDYLLTWNCRHIDNAELKPLIRSVCISNGYQYPEICTPLELMGDQDDD